VHKTEPTGTGTGTDPVTEPALSSGHQICETVHPGETNCVRDIILLCFFLKKKNIPRNLANVPIFERYFSGPWPYFVIFFFAGCFGYSSNREGIIQNKWINYEVALTLDDDDYVLSLKPKSYGLVILAAICRPITRAMFFFSFYICSLFERI
jgi:hypothetical protein